MPSLREPAETPTELSAASPTAVARAPREEEQPVAPAEPAAMPRRRAVAAPSAPLNIDTKVRPTPSDLAAKKQAIERELAQIQTVDKNNGCQCYSNPKTKECRYDSVETGKWKARVVQPTDHCDQHCKQWENQRDFRSVCASAKFWAAQKARKAELLTQLQAVDRELRAAPAR